MIKPLWVELFCKTASKQTRVDLDKSPAERSSAVEVIQDPIPVMYIITKAPEGVQGAFDLLESKLSTRRHRRFYGVFFYSTKEYRACVRIEEGDVPETLGIPQWTIPGGKYKAQKLYDWQSKVSRFPEIFSEMVKGERVDSTRPSIEYYRSMTECILYMPIE